MQSHTFKIFTISIGLPTQILQETDESDTLVKVGESLNQEGTWDEVALFIEWENQSGIAYYF